jgi:hypothetical protein
MCDYYEARELLKYLCFLLFKKTQILLGALVANLGSLWNKVYKRNWKANVNIMSSDRVICPWFIEYSYIEVMLH